MFSKLMKSVCGLLAFFAIVSCLIGGFLFWALAFIDLLHNGFKLWHIPAIVLLVMLLISTGKMFWDELEAKLHLKKEDYITFDELAEKHKEGRTVELVLKNGAKIKIVANSEVPEGTYLVVLNDN